MLTFSCNFLEGFCKGEGRANMLRAINMVHTRWQQQSLMYINVKKNLNSLKQCLTATRPTSHN